MTRYLMSLLFLIVAVGACDKGDAAKAPAGGSAGSAAPTAGSAAQTAPNPKEGTPPAGKEPAGTTTTEAAAAPAGPKFKVGDKVDGKWTDGQWYPGKIAAVNPDGTFKVAYDDGDVSKALPESKVRARKRSSGSSSSGGARCGGGLTRCGGRCVDLQNDPKNCWQCGRECPEACMGASCVSNAYKYGN